MGSLRSFHYLLSKLRHHQSLPTPTFPLFVWFPVVLRRFFESVFVRVEGAGADTGLRRDGEGINHGRGSSRDRIPRSHSVNWTRFHKHSPHRVVSVFRVSQWTAGSHKFCVWETQISDEGGEFRPFPFRRRFQRTIDGRYNLLWSVHWWLADGPSPTYP